MKTVAFINMSFPETANVDIPVDIQLTGNRLTFLEPSVVKFVEPGSRLKVLDENNKIKVFEVLDVEIPSVTVREISYFEDRRRRIRFPFVGRYQGFFISAFSDIPDIFLLRNLSIDAVLIKSFPDFENYLNEDFEVNGRFVFPKLNVRSQVFSFRVMRISDDGLILEMLGNKKFLEDLMVNISSEIKKILKEL